MNADAASDFIARAKLDGLKPGQTYHYRLVFGADEANAQAGPTRQFKTLNPADAKAGVSFCMGSCMNYHAFMHGEANGGGPVTATDEDKRLGYPSFAAMTALKPDFFIGTGDIVYYDHPATTAAKTLPELRKKWHEQFRFPRMVAARKLLSRPPHRKRSERGRASGSEGFWGSEGQKKDEVRW